MEIGGIGDYQGTGRERDGEDLFNGYEVLFSGDESVHYLDWGGASQVYRSKLKNYII